MIILYIFIFIVSCALLVFSGGATVRGLIRMAQFLRWKEFVVAFILMAFATSIPEFFVGVTAAINGIPELSLGDIFGANIINLTLAIGLAVLFLGKLEIERETVRRNSILVAIIALLPVLLLFDGDISRIDGVILLLAFVFYITWLFDRKELFSKVYDETPEIKKKKLVEGFLRDLGIFLGSVILLLLAAHGIVKSASYFAEFIGVPVGIIGILLVGAGTALPEVYFSIRAGRAGQPGMILGNLMGCVAITSTLVLGVVALICPIKIADFSPFAAARIFLLISVLLFLFISRTHEKISKTEAIILLLIYFVFLVFEIIL